MKEVLSVLFLIAFHIQVSVSKDLPCAKRQAEFGWVCVCNSSYCDTIKRPSPLTKGLYYHYTTSNDNPGFHRTTGFFSGDHTVDNQTRVFTVNPSIKYQEIFGFGGAFTDSVGAVVNSLPPDAQDKFVKSYFSKNGIEFSMGRVPIGATDFSPRLYSYDDVPNDVELKHFNLTEEDFRYKIPLITRAQSVSPHEMKLVGCMFSAPKWMKMSDTWRASYVHENYFDALSRYHIKFLDAYADNGIKFWYLTGGNEVTLGLVCQGCLIIANGAFPHDHMRWLRDHLAPLLAASNHTNIKLLILDDMRMFANFWMSRFAQDRKSYQIIDGIAVHWYMDWLVPDYIYKETAEQFHSSYPDKLMFYTESSINILFKGERVELGSFERGAMYSYNIIKNLNFWTSGYLDWNIALDTEGGPHINLPTDAAVIVNASNGEFYKNPIFYSIGHFSKFIPPGSRRVDVQSNQNTITTKSDQLSLDSILQTIRGESYNGPKDVLSDYPTPQLPHDVTCLATTNPDNSSTVIVLNTMDYDVNVTIVDTVSGNISATVTANSINTFVYWP